MLPLATLVHNNMRNSATGHAPNQLIYGLEPTVTPDVTTQTNNPTVELRIKQLKQ